MRLPGVKSRHGSCPSDSVGLQCSALSEPGLGAPVFFLLYLPLTLPTMTFASAARSFFARILALSMCFFDGRARVPCRFVAAPCATYLAGTIPAVVFGIV